MKDLKILDNNKVRWETIDQEHIKVTFVGHFDENYAQLERELNKVGMHAIKRSYNKKLNKTITTYKRAKNVF